MSSFGLVPAVWLLCVTPFLVMLVGCGAGSETAVSRLPFQQNQQIQHNSQLPSSQSLGQAKAVVSGSSANGIGPFDQAAPVPTELAVLDEPVELEVVNRFEQAMTAYRAARSQPVRPDFPLLELTHTPATAVQLKAGLQQQRDNRLALRYPNGQKFSARYAAVSISGGVAAGVTGSGVVGDGAIADTATVTGCTHYRAIEFDSSNGSDVAEFDERVSFTAQLVLSPDQDWLLDAYVAFPLDTWGENHC